MEVTEQQKGLHVRDLLKNAYDKLNQQHKNREIIFPNRALTEIADDSDWHRSRTGHMGYESARAFQFNGKVWVVARGEKCGSYPAEPYDSDVMALEFPLKGRITKATKEELARKIGESSYFRNSLIYGMADGNLAVSKRGRFGKQMLELLGPKVQEFIAQKPEYDRSVILASTLRYPTTKNMLYKPEFADFLAESFEAVLTSQ
ncbi:MAG: hypothetical protein KKB21_04490 [Nanoarchaeota archaeon]|nr:hypothetical protein [Nanoarchaeota archaeon]MBU4086804.1 hypothetical protein [Nanoarchaeota archaeon]